MSWWAAFKNKISKIKDYIPHCTYGTTSTKTKRKTKRKAKSKK